MSGGLVLKLAPGERVLINGAVIENGDKRARVTLVTPNANVLRLRDAIHPEDAQTPVKRLCYVIQLAVAGEVEPEQARRQALNGVDQLSGVFDDESSQAILDQTSAYLVEKRFYPALRALRGLIPLEANILLGPAAPQAGRTVQ